MRVDRSLQWLIVAATILVGCGNSNSAGSSGGTGVDNSVPGEGPGRLSLTRMDGMETRDLVTDSAFPGLAPQDGVDAGELDPDPAAPEGPITFDLGELNGSRDYYFILRNPGATAVTNVTIESSDPAFPVSPAAISVVESEATASLVPVIRATAVHGTTIGGVGWQPILSPGPHTWTLTLAGETTDPETGDPLTLTSTAELTVTALVFDIEAFDGTDQIDLAHAPTMTGDDPGYEIAASFPTIKNTGNVPITVRSLANPPTQPMLQEVVLAPSDSTTELDVSSWCPNNAPQSCYHLEIDGSNTVADTERLPVKADGRIRVYFMHP